MPPETAQCPVCGRYRPLNEMPACQGRCGRRLCGDCGAASGVCPTCVASGAASAYGRTAHAMTQTQTSIYTAPAQGLEIVPGEWIATEPPGRSWRIACPGIDSRQLAVAELRWSQASRHWILRRTLLFGLPCERAWHDPSCDRPREVPHWLATAAVAQAGAWALFAAAHLLDQEKALSKLAGDLAAQVRADRDAFVECSADDRGDFDTDADAQEAADYDQLIRRAEALLALAPSRGEEKESRNL